MKVPKQVKVRLENLKNRVDIDGWYTVEEIMIDINEYVTKGSGWDYIKEPAEWLRSLTHGKRDKVYIGMTLYLAGVESIEEQTYTVEKEGGYTLEEAEQITENFGGNVILKEN